MPPRHTLLALAIATIWGLTFVSIKIGLQTLPPFALSGWRFFLAAVPLVFFVGRPQAPWSWLLLYGLLIAIGQFVVLFIALNLGFPAGLMSLVVQMQVFFTIGLAMFLYRETVNRLQWWGALIATLGLAVIGATKLQGGVGVAFFLVLFAAFCWAAGNTVAKHVAKLAASKGDAKINPMNFIAWTSVAAVPPLIVISLAMEPAGSLLIPIIHPSWALCFHLCVLAYAAQVFGYGLWSNLLTRYPASAVSPFALWVPVAGMSATAWAFGETLSALQIVGALIVMAGLAVAVVLPGLLARNTTR
ncbi:MAG: O-acetylserine/cysteine exporter [Betaproteobacteria bacterium]|nr:MAG: O-acetylserine/cysteine exporter [Betaproteobacteria bacterium]